MSQLRRATIEGRLTAAELEERIARVLIARTYGDLDALVVDLPVSRRPVSRGDAPSHARPWMPLAVAIALMTLLLRALGDHADGGAVDWRRGGHLEPGDSFIGAHHLAAQAAVSGLTIVVLCVTCAMLVWAFMRRRDG